MEITRDTVSEIQSGRTTVGTTCAKLSDDNSTINRGVILRAHPDNTGIIYVGSHQMVCEAGAVAYATHYSPGENDDVVFHAPAAGAEYNDVEFGWFDDAPPGMPPEIVQVADRFEVHFALGETTAMDVKAAFDCAGFAWWCCVSGDGSGIIETVGIDFSVGGADPVIPEGFALGPGEEVTIPVDRLSKVFAVADTDGQVVSWFAG